MRSVILLVALSFSVLQCGAQELAFAQQSTAGISYHQPSAFSNVPRSHRQSVMGTVGTWSMLGGVVLFLGGYAEYKGATTTSGPFTFVDQGKQNLGTAMEIFGGSVFVTGLVLVIVDAAGRRSHNKSALQLAAPKRNEVGIAYKF